MGRMNAAGSHTLPMYIFAAQRRNVQWMSDAPLGMCVLYLSRQTIMDIYSDTRLKGWLVSFLKHPPIF